MLANSGYGEISSRHLRTGISSLADLGKYHRDFVSITTFLIAKNRLATPEQSRTFTRAFPSELWSQVSYRLQLKFPDHFPDDPYTLEQIHDAAHFVLHGTAASADMPRMQQRSMKPEI